MLWSVRPLPIGRFLRRGGLTHKEMLEATEQDRADAVQERHRSRV